MALTRRALSQASLERAVPDAIYPLYAAGCLEEQEESVLDIERKLERMSRGLKHPDAERAAHAEIAAKRREKAPMSEAAFRRFCVETGLGSFDTRSQVHHLQTIVGRHQRNQIWKSELIDIDLQIRDDQAASYVSMLLRDIGVPMCAEDFHHELSPEQRAALGNDPTFHPGELARKWSGDPAYRMAIAPRESEWIDDYARNGGDHWPTFHRSLEKAFDPLPGGVSVAEAKPQPTNAQPVDPDLALRQRQAAERLRAEQFEFSERARLRVLKTEIEAGEAKAAARAAERSAAEARDHASRTRN